MDAQTDHRARPAYVPTRRRGSVDRVVLCGIAAALMIGLAGSAGAQADWPGFGGPNHDGKSSDTGLLKQWPEGGPKLLWKAPGIGKGYSSVAVVDGIAYTTGDIAGRLFVSAIDSTGKGLWQAVADSAWEGDHPGARSTPTLDGGNLYIESGNGVVGCHDAKTGKRKWVQNLRDLGGSPHGWGYAESVLILGKLAIVTPGGEHCIVALDKATGKPVWSTSGWQAVPQYGGNYPFVRDGVPMIANGTSEGLACVNARDGSLLWYNTFSAHNTANCPTPIYSEGYVFWANGYGKGGLCLKLSAAGGKVSAQEAWRTRDMDCHHGGYVVHEGYVYGNNGGGWACLDLKTGRTMWKNGGVGKGSLCYADGMLYLFGEDGGRVGLATCSPQGMELRGTFSVQGNGPSWAHPVVIGGRLYLRYDDNLYCYDVKTD
ncbi:MAG: polyvinylalcohol dehydrogenase [Armatimonadetes bacterium CG_4_10_14_3_um_filter_66_18]|nr:PQQ-binding-like beta-propeller repeat protein [Armatimonadota bacterium]PIU91995.1 MAG: polyvinylalcohol dehydrogenase [Armatimonadetes bacterium CG06_land_8_20_14_3_00_66_21]PIY50052.1 MAG: polyvinylalcohol dehydrogenase [Armatimonadetes bacterium CG_4_10_14_3_um_filter_66_18]PIZ30646.1 MAG: polyvinylalcohol dehydrogenase [Armatimonadetes bacterium CG_4_10_14_0_8_um_filter_66_14]PJB71221.1 MAG: polyvinylalcohol dehydrogenase [Armatimonadetes bacterium CG_4_9_14_3_um_filter_66_14]